MNLAGRLEAAFGVPELPHALFHALPNALRFDLGGEHSVATDPVRRFLQGIDRARSICRAAFAGSKSVEVVASLYGAAQRGKPERRALRRLDQAGFNSGRLKSLESIPQNDAGYLAEHGCDLHRHWFGATLSDPNADIDRLLWCAIADELPIEPSATLDIYFVDFQRRLIAHPYDDRGMDVAAGSPRPLAPIAAKFASWRMNVTGA